MKPRQNSRARWFLVPLALAATWGCGGFDRRAVRSSDLNRLAVVPDARVFSLSELFDEVEVRRWAFGTPKAADRWVVSPATAKIRVDRSGLWLKPTGDDSFHVSITSRVNFSAHETPVVEVVLNNATHVASWVYWAGPGEEFANDRRVRVSQTNRRGGAVRVLRFHLDEHPRWTGEIRRLRIAPAIDAVNDFCVVSVAAIKDTIDPERIDAAAGRPWKLDLDGTIRDAVIGFPDRTWSMTAEVPRGNPVLTFVPGLPEGLAGPVGLAISAIENGGEPVEIWSQSFGGDTGFEPGWQDPVSVPLAGLEGRTVRFELSTVGVDRPRREVGFPAWGSLAVEAEGQPSEASPNVILICLDTLRADHVSSYGYSRETTPNIDRWAARRGVLFETVVAPAPWTLPSHITMFTGLDTIRHGANYHVPARPEFDMLAERFAASGYETVAWTGGGFLGSSYGLHQGFDVYTYWRAQKEDEIEVHVTQAVDWLSEDRDQPFFMFFHTYEVHEPYFEREPFFSRFAADSGNPRIPSDWLGTRRVKRRPDDGFKASKVLRMSPDRGRTWEPVPTDLRPGVIDRYDAGLAFTDFQIGRLLDAVETLGRFEDTVILVTSDHGEGLGEHGLDGHNYLYDFNVLVPMIVSAPGRDWPRGLRVPQQVRLTDMMPTLLDLAGLGIPEGLDGETLVPLIRDPANGEDRPGWIYAGASNRGVALRTPQIKYIFNNTAWRPVFGQERIYDLAADPGEDANLAGDLSSDAEVFRRIVNDRVVSDLVGVWIRVKGAESVGLTIQLEGKDVANPARLKGLSLPGTGVTYVEGDEPHALVKVPAGGLAELYSEASVESSLTISARLSSGGGAKDRWEIDLADLTESSWSARHDNVLWSTTGEPVVAGGASIEVFTTGDLGAESSPESVSQDVADQLRALGYIE
jgi:arylsulfatase A-like enzyme